VAADLLGDWTEKLRVDSAVVRKHEIARSILVALNEQNTNGALQLRREVLKRVVEVEDFSIAWPDDRERAENLVNRIRKVVDQHNSFTRMRREAEVEKREKREAYNAQVESRKKQSEERTRIRSKLNALFAEPDHHKRGRACEEALGMQPGKAMAACQTNCAEARDLALEASPLYQPLAELAREGFTGTVAELHARLDSMVSDAIRRSVRWPKAPNILSNALRRMATSLREAGIEVEFSRPDHSGRRVVSVLTISTFSKSSSALSAVAPRGY
jgi:hypothetical protein